MGGDGLGRVGGGKAAGLVGLHGAVLLALMARTVGPRMARTGGGEALEDSQPLAVEWHVCRRLARLCVEVIAS
jgi:hypothetical protein